MEEKLKKKRIRRVLLIVISAALVIGTLMSMNIERADYGKALSEEIENAKELLCDAKTGYDKGEYLPEAVTYFQQCIEEAEEVYDDSSSNYEDQKAAYEKLKEDEEAFKDSVNEKDLEKKEVEEKEKEEVLEDETSIVKDSEENTNKSEKESSKSKESSSTAAGKKEVKTEDEYITVTIQIRCDNLLESEIDESIKEYVPDSGVILKKTEYRCKKGTTVYDCLYAVCRNNNIQIESQYTPVYNSQYVEAINHIYEFDGGSESGWMFRVNGGYPDYACSSCSLNDGDNIVWAYTCNLGKDIGDAL